MDGVSTPTETVASLHPTQHRPRPSPATAHQTEMPHVSGETSILARGEILQGATLGDLLVELRRNVQRELLTALPGDLAGRDAIRSALAQDLTLLDRGVEMRALFLASTARTHGTRDYLERVASAGGRVRLRSTLPFPMVLADRSVAVCVPPGPGPGTAGSAVVIRGAALVHLLREVFDHCWSEATPLVARQRPGAEELDAEQRLMLRMLSAGLSDQAIARQLGIAPRTLTRKLRALLCHLGIQTRFQAGVEAAHRGLL